MFLEVNGVEVEEELYTVATVSLGRRNLDWKMAQRAERIMEKADL